MNSGVYKIQNTINGKCYIGSATHFATRWATHRHALRKGTHHSRKLQNAWNKHGEESFIFAKLLVCAPTAAVFYEQRALDAYASVRLGYNISPTAGSTLGVKPTAQTLAKISAALKGRPANLAAVEKTAVKNRGRKHTPETRAKVSAALKGLKRAPEQCARISASKAGFTPSRAMLDAARAATLGKPRAPEAVAKGRATRALSTYVASAETRAKQSAASAGRVASPETRAKLALARKGRTPALGMVHSAETRAKMSATAARKRAGVFTLLVVLLLNIKAKQNG